MSVGLDRSPYEQFATSSHPVLGFQIFILCLLSMTLAVPSKAMRVAPTISLEQTFANGLPDSVSAVSLSSSCFPMPLLLAVPRPVGVSSLEMCGAS